MAYTTINKSTDYFNTSLYTGIGSSQSVNDSRKLNNSYKKIGSDTGSIESIAGLENYSTGTNGFYLQSPGGYDSGIQIDLGASYTVQKIEWFSKADYGRFKYYKIKYSTDNNTYTEISDMTGSGIATGTNTNILTASNSNGMAIATFANKTARYIQILFDDYHAGSNNNCKLAALGIFVDELKQSFQPDWTWIKNRDQTDDHKMFDAVRGVTKVIKTNTSGAETTDSNTLTAFGTNGFTVGTDGGVNSNGEDLVAWNWKAGTGQGSSNTDGSINTIYTSVNTTAGFSISKYTGTGSNATVGHGLGAVPKIVITKNLSSSNNWAMYHASTGNTKSLQLDTTGAPATSAAYWNNTTPTSSVFTVSTGNDVNKSGDSMIAYCFLEKPGYSKFGSYVGNESSNGPFIYTGFKPAWVMWKRTEAAGENWYINDNKREPFNDNSMSVLYPNLNNAEGNLTDEIDLLSNGFKIRGNNSAHNTSGAIYVYLAFGQSLVGSNNIPCTAR